MEYQTEFLERKERTPTSISYRFKIPEGLIFTAGQHMLVDLGNELAHPLTLSSCPEETGFIEFTKRMTGSSYCLRLESLKAGDTIRLRGPAGNFSLAGASGTIVMIAGGIGITPIWSILNSLEKMKGNTCSIVLIYGNFNREDIAFREELENLHLSDFHIVHVLSDTAGMKGAYKGIINADIILKEVQKAGTAQYMVSGPPAMLNAIKKALATINVPEERVRTDVFYGYE